MLYLTLVRVTEDDEPPIRRHPRRRKRRRKAGGYIGVAGIAVMPPVDERSRLIPPWLA